MNLDLDYLLTFLVYGLRYLPNTLYMTILSLVFGVILGGLIAIVRTYKVKVLDPVLTALLAILKAIPTNLIMVMSSIIFTANFARVTEAWGIDMSLRDFNMTYLAAFALILSAIASLSESIRGALMSVPKTQYDAGYSIGLTKTQNFIRIVLPQAFQVMLPSMMSNVTGLIKMTSLASTLGIMDVLNGCLQKSGTSYRFLEAYLAAAIIYWVISILLELIGRRLEKGLGKYRRQAL